MYADIDIDVIAHLGYVRNINLSSRGYFSILLLCSYCKHMKM